MKFSKGFSLVEVLVVVAILGMLAAIGIPKYAKYRDSSKRAGAKSGIANIVRMQNSVYANSGSFVPFVGSGLAAITIGGETLFGACASNCGHYNFRLALGGGNSCAQRSDITCTNYPATVKGSSAFNASLGGYERFQVLAQGNIVPDAEKEGDVLFYDQATDITIQACNDVDGPFAQANCQYP
jgi:prepilin-type N-terminal cleavage/methylation domain-containing protein